MESGKRPAAFCDRDGTLIVEKHFLADPDGVEVLPGVTEALKRLAAAGYVIVVATNQSGVARGLMTVKDVNAVHRRLQEILRGQGALVEKYCFCPTHPDGTVPEYTREDNCRKPGTGMFKQAAFELGIDLERSWGIGDTLRDLEPVKKLGGRTVLIGTGEPLPEVVPDFVDHIAGDFSAAADIILKDTEQST